MHAVYKGFACINMCIQYEYGNILRECDGLSLLTEFVTIYADKWTESITYLDYYTKDVLDSVLDITCDVIDMSRRSGFGESDNGVQFIHQPCFSAICTKICTSSFVDNEYLWIDVITLLKEAIVSEPTFLSVVLSSDYVEPFSNALKIDNGSFLWTSLSKSDSLLLPLALTRDLPASV